MTGEEFRIWREGAGITQAKAGIMAGISRKTIVRAEAAVDEQIPSKMARIVSEQGLDEIPLKGGGVIEVQGAPSFNLIKTPAEAAARVSGGIEVTPELKAAMLRNPPFAKTAAEAKAMRHLRASQKPKQADGSPYPVSKIRLLPLRPDWVRLPSGRKVNAAIPNPLDVEPPAWAGPRGVVTAKGDVYDYEAAHKMHPPFEFGSAQSTAGEW